MIGRAAFRADAPSGHALFDSLVGYFDVNDLVDLDSHILQSLCLGNGAREAVQNEAALAVIFGKALLDDADDNIVRNKFAGLDIGLGLNAHLSAIGKCFANDITSGDGRNAVGIGDALSLGAFAGARCSKENNVHFTTFLSGSVKETLIVAYHKLGFQLTYRLEGYTYYDDNRSTAKCNVHLAAGCSRNLSEDDRENGDNTDKQRTQESNSGKFSLNVIRSRFAGADARDGAVLPGCTEWYCRNSRRT